MKPFALLVLSLVPFGVASPQAVTPDPASERIQYVLAPMDRIHIHAPHAPKLNDRSFQIQPDGIVTLPSVGRIQAAGLNTSELEKTVAARLKLKPKTPGEPAVAISVMATSNK